MKRPLVLLASLAVILVLSAGIASAAELPAGMPFLASPGWWKLATNGGGVKSNAGTAPAGFGAGSLELSAGPGATAGSGGQVVLSTDLGVLPGVTKLTDLQELSFWTYEYTWSASNAAPTLQLSVDIDGDLQWDTTLVYVPNFNGTVTKGVWQHWNAVGGVWYSTHGIGIADQNSPATLAAIVASNPAYANAAISIAPSDPGGSVRIQFGSSGGDYHDLYARVDGVVIRSATVPKFKTDFEPSAV